jgi:hypothetical protein
MEHFEEMCHTGGFVRSRYDIGLVRLSISFFTIQR